MIYAATSVWLTLILLMAWSIHRLWQGIVKARTVNGVLLPGTLIAQLGHVIGLLITGATVHDTALVGDNDRGEPSTQPGFKPKIPFVGPIVVALLPMLALGGAIFLLVVRLGRPVIVHVPVDALSMELPVTLAAFWDQLRALVTLAEETLRAASNTGAITWKTGLFTYLMVCFTVRMAPIPGNVRGHIGAIAALGCMAALAATLSPRPLKIIQDAWPILSLTMGWLLLLMLLSLVARGVVESIQMIGRSAGSND